MKILLRLYHAKIASVVILSFTELPHHHLLALFPFPFTVKVPLLELYWALYRWLLTYLGLPPFHTHVLPSATESFSCAHNLFRTSLHEKYLSQVAATWVAFWPSIFEHFSVFVLLWFFFNYKMLKGWFLLDVSKFLIIDSDTWLYHSAFGSCFAFVVLNLGCTLELRWKS